jgi:hypothetical protein
MYNKAKHSKFRNTGLLFELLTRQVTSEILAGAEKSAAKDLLFKYFAPNTELGREWQLYTFLVNETAKDEATAEKYITIALRQREKINHKNLIQQKYNLIKEMNEVYSTDKLLKSSLKNYKLFASIYKIFEDQVNSNSKFDVNEIVQARTCIAENLYQPKKKHVDVEDATLKLYKEQTEDIRMLSYKIMMDKLNEKFDNLNGPQKRLLREFINNVTNTDTLNKLISEEIQNVKSELVKLNSQVTYDVIKIKINETINQLSNVKPSKTVKDSHVMILLLSYELIKEIKATI